MLSRIIILACVFALAASAPQKWDDGEVVAVALEKYAEYMVVPENQNELWYEAKAEELKAIEESTSDDENEFREVEKDVATKEDQKNNSIFDALLSEMGCAKNIIVGLPVILDTINECEDILEDDSIRRKRDLAEWFKNGYENFKDKASDVRSFLKTDVKDFFTHNVTKFITEDVPDFLSEDVAEFLKEDVADFFKKDVKEFFSNDLKEFFVENYANAKEFLGLTSEDGKSSFQERMDDFLSTTRKGLKKAGLFGYCVITKNLDNPLLRTIVDIFA